MWELSNVMKGYTFADRGKKWSCSPLSASNATGLAEFAEEGATKETILAKIDGIAVCYKLATPVTYTLTTPVINSLLGENNVWADTGNVTVTYTKYGEVI